MTTAQTPDQNEDPLALDIRDSDALAAKLRQRAATKNDVLDAIHVALSAAKSAGGIAGILVPGAQLAGVLGGVLGAVDAAMQAARAGSLTKGDVADLASAAANLARASGAPPDEVGKAVKVASAILAGPALS